MICGALAGCGKTEKGLSDINFSTDTRAYVFTLENSAAAYGTDTDLMVACRSCILMPETVLGNNIASLRDTVNELAFGNTGGQSLPGEYFRNAAQEFGFNASVLDITVDAADSIKGCTAAIAGYDGYITVDGFVQSMTGRILCYAVEASEYAPRAAHGMYSVNYINYDMSQGKVFSLSDLFTTNGMTELPSIISAKAASMTGYIGQTSIDSLPSGNNFTVTPDGNIVFVYQPYEVASYAQGIISIPVAAYTVDSLLTDYGKKLLLSE